MEDFNRQLKTIVNALFNYNGEISAERPHQQFGDFSTNLAIKLAKKLRQNPVEIADKISEKLKNLNVYKDVKVVTPGFINVTLRDETLLELLEKNITKPNKNQEIVVEYSDPNPFKILHAGHLYTSIVGDGIANLLATTGANIHRVNFGGDVGLHVAKTMWAILQKLGGENPQKLDEIKDSEHSNWLTRAYIEGNNAYDDNESSKQEITVLNKKIYDIHASGDHDSKLAQIYWTTRKWSYDYFDEFYKTIGSKFEKYYPESATVEIGLKTVKEQLQKDVFKNSDGAVIFDGEKFELHTRVFINKEGLPTYETKDIGLIMLKKQDYNFDKSIVITGNEQEQYMQVVLKAVEQFAPELSNASTHITHGMVKLEGGEKMSSRKGNILKAVDIIDAARVATRKINNKPNEKVVLTAVKYSFLKQRIGGDIIYSPEESVGIEGNSGPYLQYAYVRAKSILSKSKQSEVNAKELTKDERTLVSKLSEYPEAIVKATNELMPHHVCTYIYELAQAFNHFYEKNRIIGDEREAIRLAIVKKYEQVLKNSFEILNMPIVDKM